MSNNHYNKNLKPFARKLRNGSTKAEIRMWCELLRNKQMMGYPFLRQRPIGNYIADFFCKELKLVIELDGLTHHWEETVAKDAEKEKTLKEMGYQVLRFQDDEVIKEIHRVGEVIRDWIEAHKKNSSPIENS